MNWTAYVDGYCERVAPGLWGEPLNAVTNLAFVLAAISPMVVRVGRRTRFVLVAALMIGVY